MNNTSLQLVTFEQAVKLDQLGFKYPTRERYNYADEGMHITESATPRNHNDRFCWVNKKKEGCSAPTVALALKWFRDMHNLFGLVNMDGCGAFIFEILEEKAFDMVCDNGGTFDTYEAAESALLDELLSLIKNENQN